MLVEYSTCREAQMEIAFAGGYGVDRPLHDYRSRSNSTIDIPTHTHSPSLLFLQFPPGRVLAIYLMDLLLDLEARFVALMGCIISSFAPSFEKETRPAGRRQHDAVDRRAPRCLGSIAPGPTHKQPIKCRKNICMIIALEFVEYNDYQINIGRHYLASSTF